MVGRVLDYNILLNNFHQFSSGCLTNNFDNADFHLSLLKQKARTSISANAWRDWDTAEGIYL